MQVTIIGNLTANPELRFLDSGVAKSNLRVAENRRYQDRSGEWQEETSYWTVIAWRDLAENIAESLKRGDRIMVAGRMLSRSYETSNGEKRYVTEIVADSVGPDLRWATVTEIVKATKGNGGGNNGGRAPAQARREPAPVAASADDFDPYNPDSSPF